MKYPIVPVVGDGKYKVFPVTRDNIALTFSKVIDLHAAHSKIFPVGGQTLTYIQLVNRLARAMGRKAFLISVPIWMVKTATLFLGWLPSFPVQAIKLQCSWKGMRLMTAQFGNY